MKQSSDNEHLQTAFNLLSDGKLEALDEVWKLLSRPLHHYAVALTGSQDEADDLLGEVFLNLMRQGVRLKNVKEPRAYLYKAVRNAACSWRRKFSRLSLTGDQLPQIYLLEIKDETLAIRQAVMTLPPAQREVIVLHVWGELTFEEVARVMKISADTTASRYRYALARLRKELNDDIEL